jgi:2Fe-2S ferredoxin
MATITIMPSGKTVEAEVGKTLLETVLAAGETLKHECDGNSECGSCHLFVQTGRKSVSRNTGLSCANTCSVKQTGYS